MSIRNTLRVAAVQYPIEGGQSVSSFLKKVDAFVAEALNQKAELIVFPELFALDLLPDVPAGSDPTAAIAAENRAIAESIIPAAPQLIETFEMMSRKSGASILAGSFPRRLQDGRIVNSALLTFPGGAKPVIQDKLYSTYCEKTDWKWQGGDALHVFEAPWGRTVISTCYDAEFPGLSSQLAPHRPELILVPSCTGSLQGFQRVRWTAQARAIEHYAFVVHTGTVGPGTQTPNMNTQYGQAALLTPSDDRCPGILAQGQANAAQVVVGELDFARLREGRAKTHIYPARDQEDRRTRNPQELTLVRLHS